MHEEPRLREQDFGNFQPCSAEMERMWQERADYGHFFYRIPNGESAADAYDRVSGFNESMWRQFNEPDFPSVCVLVTHGLMTRVFLMKWCVLAPPLPPGPAPSLTSTGTTGRSNTLRICAT